MEGTDCKAGFPAPLVVGQIVAVDYVDFLVNDGPCVGCGGQPVFDPKNYDKTWGKGSGICGWIYSGARRFDYFHVSQIASLPMLRRAFPQASERQVSSPFAAGAHAAT